MPFKLLFVCLGNICRSPAAENIMSHLIEQANLGEQIICDSAGTAGYHIGSSPDERMAAATDSQLQIKLRGRARQFKKSDLQNFDLILAMDLENYQNIVALDQGGQYKQKVRLICDFCSIHTTEEVPDPYYGGTEGFSYVVNLLLDACKGLLDYIVMSDFKGTSPVLDPPS